MKYIQTYENFKIIYSAVFLYTKELVERYGQTYENLYSDHITIEFKPENINDLQIGDNITLHITGRLITEKLDVLIVDCDLSKNETPHITLSTKNDTKPFESNNEIKKHKDNIEKLNDYIIGTVGYFDGKNKIKKAVK